MADAENTLANRLASLKNPKESDAKFATRVGESVSTLGNYLRGTRIPNAEFLARLKAATGCDLNWLVSGDSSRPMLHGGFHEDALAHLTMVPAVVARLGHIGVEADPATSIPLDTGWLVALGLEPDECGHLVATGAGMTPVIPDGATMIVSFAKTEKMRPGAIYILAIDDDILVRRYNPQPDGSIELLCENPSFPPRVLTREQFRALGRPHLVVWAGHRL